MVAHGNLKLNTDINSDARHQSLSLGWSLCALSIVPMIYCYTRGPKRATSTTRSLLSLAAALAWQRGPHNPAVTTGTLTAAHRVPIIRTFQRNVGLFASLAFSFFFFKDLPSAQWGRPPTFRRQNLQGDGHGPPSLEELSKNIRCRCPIFCFTPKPSGSGCSRSKLFPPDSHMGLTAL